MKSTSLTDLLRIEFPLIQAGMGGVAGPALVTAVAEAGAAGVLGLYKLPADDIKQVLERTRSMTNKPFGVNFVPEVVDLSYLQAQVSTVINYGDPTIFFSFFGIPPLDICHKIKNRSHVLLIMVGTTTDVTKAINHSADAVILQGNKGGGHLLGRQSLKELLLSAKKLDINIPLIAAGGISSGVQYQELSTMGADGCLCGTIFVATAESDAHDSYKSQLVSAFAQNTIVTNCFNIGWPKRPHRVLLNDVVYADRKKKPETFIAITKMHGKLYPISRYSCAVPINTTRGSIEEMAMYCGMSVSGVKAIRSASEVVKLFREDFLAATEKHAKSKMEQLV